MILATSYDGFALPVVGIPFFALSSFVLLGVMLGSFFAKSRRVARRRAGMTVLIVASQYVVLCPIISGVPWFPISSQDTTTAEYSQILMIGFLVCTLLSVASLIAASFAKDTAGTPLVAAPESNLGANGISADTDLNPYQSPRNP